MKKDSLGDRMKTYENVTRTKLYRRTPVIIRLDGKAFHTLTKEFDKPFDLGFINRMRITASSLFDLIGGNLKMVYVQSDEISLLLTDWDRFETQGFYDYNIQKLVSTTAAQATMKFNEGNWRKSGIFDSRAFNIPKEDVCNYFIWRQQDWERNSIQMLGQAHFSHKDLHKKSLIDIQDMLHDKGINWNDCDTYLKRGTCLYNEWLADGEKFLKTDNNIPIFTKDRYFIEQFLEKSDE